MKSRWITHKGQQIFHIDLTGFRTDVEAFEAELLAAETVTCQQPEGSLLVLTDVRGTAVSVEALRIAKNSSARTTQYVRKTAVLGISGIRKVMLDAISRFSGQQFATFDDIEQAKDWLVRDG